MKYVVLVVALACSSKKSDEPSPSPSPSPSTSPSTSTSTSTSAGGSLKWMAIDPFGIEAEVPSCSQNMASDENSVHIIAGGDATCTAMALTFNKMDKPGTYDETLQTLTNGLSPEFTRKEKTPEGWAFEYQQKESGDTLPHLHVWAQLKNIQCVSDTMDPKEAAAQRHACESMRVKK